jgi:spastic paraplegia protein 7
MYTGFYFYYFSFKVYKHIKREYQAVFSLLHRSGLRPAQQLPYYLHGRSIHSTGSTPQQQPPPNNRDDKKPNKDDDDDSKISSLLAKAFLWMLTAYMLIAIVSLLFPSSNQPEVSCMYKQVSNVWSRVLSSAV